MNTDNTTPRLYCAWGTAGVYSGPIVDKRLTGDRIAVVEDWEWRQRICRAVNSHDALRDALRAIIDAAPDDEPDGEDYDDTESAAARGVECGLWEAAQIARAALALAEQEATP